jgi:hypothetical protein
LLTRGFGRVDHGGKGHVGVAGVATGFLQEAIIQRRGMPLFPQMAISSQFLALTGVGPVGAQVDMGGRPAAILTPGRSFRSSLKRRCDDGFALGEFLLPFSHDPMTSGGRCEWQAWFGIWRRPPQASRGRCNG